MTQNRMCDRKKRIIIWLRTFLFAFFICFLLIAFYIRQTNALDYSLMEQQVITNSNKVSSAISNMLYKTQTLATLVIQSNGNVTNFEQTASVIVDSPCIRNVILAPNGIVSDVYPLGGNEAVLGFDYFSDSEGNVEAIQARDSGSLVLGGPFNLVQGGMAIVGRLPIYLENESGEKVFWGLVSITLSYPEVLENIGLEELQSQGLAYEIWRISPDTGERQMIANSNYSYNPRANYIEQAFTIENAKWYFRLSPIRNWYEYPLTWILTLAGILLSVLASSLVLHNYDLKKIRTELEELIVNDPLTGALNRRGLFHYLNDLTALSDSRFILCYIDLNHFKQINDTYGHLMGDQTLLRFSRLAAECIKDTEHVFARIGGDEFILVVNHTINPSDAEFFLNKIRESLPTLSLPFSLTFSSGKAVFPTDGQTVDALIHTADIHMYEMKAGILHNSLPLT